MKLPWELLLFQYQVYTRKITGIQLFRRMDFVIFMRNTVPEEYVHLNNHEHYHKEVYNPCMDYIRKLIHGFDDDKILELSHEFQ